MMPFRTVAALMFAASVARSETPAQFFDDANRDYQQGRFSDAIARYEQILRNGVAAGELYYNLGNAYYKSGNVSRAILNYERALRLMPGDDDLRHNLQLANLMITDRIEPAPRLFIWDWWAGIKSAVSLDAITWIGYGLYVLLIGSIIVIVLAQAYKLRRLGFVAAIVCGFLLLLSGLVFVGSLNDATNTNAAIVTSNVVTIKNSPDARSSDAFVLHEGVKVSITDKVNNWLKIRLADGKVGWMEEGVAEVI